MSSRNHVLVAMSGGVDSSVAAALLLDQGFVVTGIMLNLWSDPACENGNSCCTGEAQRLARSTANQLGIPFYVVDAKSVFYHEVVDYFKRSHEQGITPNPCWVCNIKVKWDVLMKQMSYFAADLIATGHYARLNQDKQKEFHLLASKDARKDQSYVLSGLTQKELAHTTFPIGNLTKNEVREKALRLKLNTAERLESQDLCFLGGKTSEQYFDGMDLHERRYGDIVDTKGNTLGQHHGLSNYTIGQRKGIRIAAPEPYYVIWKDATTNKLIVGFESDLGRKEFFVATPNWISGKEPEFPKSIQLQIRYHAKKVEAIIKKRKNNLLEVSSSVMLRDVTPGQIAAFYISDEVIGSGIIQ